VDITLMGCRALMAMMQCDAHETLKAPHSQYDQSRAAVLPAIDMADQCIAPTKNVFKQMKRKASLVL
jgi:hypothetical protein